MKNTELEFHWPITIYYEDTDAGGVVYHSNYLKFFERARTEMLRSIGVKQQQLLEEQVGFVVSHADIKFLQGAKLDDQLTVLSTVAELRKASISFCQKLVNLDGKVLCNALIKVACVDMKNMKPTAIPHLIILELSHCGK